MPTVTGLQKFLSQPQALAGRRVALLANVASVDTRFRYAWDAIHPIIGSGLVGIWSPQHGLFGQQQANMIESPDSRHPRSSVPIHSLYSQTRQPTSAMLDGVDLILVDLQDVGTRVYTFAWTVLACLHAAAQRGIEVWILDRPNPIGGAIVEGPLLDPGFQSFVGMEAIPMRHGLTLGELAQYCKKSQSIDVSLQVWPCEGWSRDQMFESTGLAWLPPSPNIPSVQSALVYPGQVLLEGTNISEGRGTTRPFECAGAPYIDGEILADCLQRKFDLPGVHFRPIRFVPTFDKHSGSECGGVFWHVTDPARFRPYACSVALLLAVRVLWPEHFRWLPPPYEYEYELAPIDILSGSDALRRAIDQAASIDQDLVDSVTAVDSSKWLERIRPILTYS
jgi:uncharacterized protein YbbC (DUF1343 family)